LKRGAALFFRHGYEKIIGVFPRVVAFVFKKWKSAQEIFFAVVVLARHLCNRKPLFPDTVQADI
jgi:hypothetical protein